MRQYKSYSRYVYHRASYILFNDCTSGVMYWLPPLEINTPITVAIALLPARYRERLY